MTARDIITATLRSIRVLGVGDNLEAEDANDAFDRLNDWIDALALERLTMFYVTRTTKDLVGGVPSYTIGTGGDLDLVRPTHIETAGVIIDPSARPPFERAVEVMTDLRWQRVHQKSLTSTFPSAIYYDHNWVATAPPVPAPPAIAPPLALYGLGRIYVWPIPDGTPCQLVLYTPVALQEFATLDTDYLFPPGYRRFIRTNLAQEVASEYGKTLTSDQVMAARTAKAAIKRGNVRPAEARVDPALLHAYESFDWRTGEPR